MCAKRTKIIATRTSSGVKIWPKCFGGRGSAPGPAGELAALPHTPSWILGRKDGKRKGGKNVRKEGAGRRDKKEGEGNREKGGGGDPSDQPCPPPNL